MNLRHKYLLHTLRTILGLFLLFSGISGFFVNIEDVPEESREMTQVLWETGIFQLVKVMEIVAGAMLVLNFLPALAALFVAPILVGAIVVNAMIMPSFLPLPIIAALLNGYLGYAYWDKYAPLFRRR